MFEKYLITAKQLARYNNAPLAEERLRYMNHLEQEGRGRSRLEGINARLLLMRTLFANVNQLFANEVHKGCCRPIDTGVPGIVLLDTFIR